MPEWRSFANSTPPVLLWSLRAGKNVLQMYPRTSLWQDSILRRQVKISTCPCVEKPARADSVSHFKTANEILTPLFGILC